MAKFQINSNFQIPNYKQKKSCPKNKDFTWNIIAPNIPRTPKDAEPIPLKNFYFQITSNRVPGDIRELCMSMATSKCITLVTRQLLSSDGTF